MIAPLLVLTACAVAATVDGLRIASSRASAFNSRWPGHARHHTIVYGFTRAGVAALCLALVATAAAIGSAGPLRPAVALLLAMEAIALGAGRLPGVSADDAVTDGPVAVALVRCAAVALGGAWALVAS